MTLPLGYAGEPVPMDVALEERCREAVEEIVGALEAAGRPKVNRVVNVVPGREIAWDDKCGQLTARVASMTPHRTQAPTTEKMSPCSIDYWWVNVEVTLLRCAETVTSRGRFPKEPALDAEGVALLKDMRIMLETLVTLDWVNDVVSWEALGPDGGTAGVSWTVRTRVDSPPCGE